jgi:hypothetical protein
MGVRGLARFYSTSQTVLLERNSGTSPTFVVDTWAFIYSCFLSSDAGVDWSTGGNYAAYTTFVKTVVQSWMCV